MSIKDTDLKSNV